MRCKSAPTNPEQGKSASNDILRPDIVSELQKKQKHLATDACFSNEANVSEFLSIVLGQVIDRMNSNVEKEKLKKGEPSRGEQYSYSREEQQKSKHLPKQKLKEKLNRQVRPDFLIYTYDR